MEDYLKTTIIKTIFTVFIDDLGSGLTFQFVKKF